MERQKDEEMAAEKGRCGEGPAKGGKGQQQPRTTATARQ